jgi:hypothetical protein
MLRTQILLVGTTANATLTQNCLCGVRVYCNIYLARLKYGKDLGFHP